MDFRDRSLPLSNQEEDGKDYTAKLPLDRKMYFQYYVQDDADAGTLMDTKIPISEVGQIQFGFWGLNHATLRRRSKVRGDYDSFVVPKAPKASNLPFPIKAKIFWYSPCSEILQIPCH